MSQPALSAFEVDRRGLAQILERRGKAFVLLELIQNALDEDVRRVTVLLEPASGRARAHVRVEDDSQAGFRDLTDAFTLFAPSYKKGNPKQRGRFNVGDKLIVALCSEASIETTTGTVTWDEEGRRRYPRRKRAAGSVFDGVVKMTRPELEEALRIARMIIVPQGIELVINGELLPERQPLAEFQATMQTELANADGVLRPTRRRTTISVYEPLPGETTHLYELGLPVVVTGDRWHVSVGQKIPVSLDRTSLITPGYLRDLRALVLNEMAEHLDTESASEKWIDDALEDENVADEAIATALELRFGKKRVVYDPSDPEANKIAASRGYTVIPATTFSKAGWANVRRSGAVLPAGQVTPSPKPFGEGPTLKLIPKEKWTDGMRHSATYAEALGKRLVGHSIAVVFANDPKWPYSATYGPSGELTFNVKRLGYVFFDGDPTREDMTRLLTHELAHEYSRDHLSADYHKAICRLAGKLLTLALDEPEFFTGFRR